MKFKLSVSVILVILFAAAVVVAVQEKGAEDIVLDSGSRGTVDFPHNLHQSALGDCSVCHSIFPKEKGGIKDLIDQGKLKKKQVMYKSCMKCHRDLKNADKKSGPVSCSKCHS